MNSTKILAKNTIILFISYIITYIFGFVYTIYSARYLGAESFGILSFAITLTTLVSILIDLGLGTLTTREISRNKSLTEKYLGNIIPIKIILSLIVLFLIFLMITVSNYNQQTITVVYILTFSSIFSSFYLFFYSIFQAYEKMEYQSLTQILNAILMFIGILFAINQKDSVITFACVYLVTSAIIFALTLFLLSWKLIIPKIHFNFDLWKYLILTAIPLSLIFMFSSTSFRIDTVLISILKGNIAVGYYSAAYKLFEAFLFIPMVFAASIFPVFSRLHITSKDSLELSYKKTIKYMTIVSLPITITTTILSNKIIIFFYGIEYGNSIIALKILFWAIPAIFLTHVFVFLFVSINKQKLIVKLTFLIMIYNILLNLIFIPFLSYTGAAITTIITEVTFLLLCLFYLSKLICKIEIKEYLFKPLFSSALMGLFLLYSSSTDFNVVLTVFIGIIIYLVTLILLKTFTREDIMLFNRIIDLKGK